MENSLPTRELIRSLTEAGDISECISLMNSSGFEGSDTDAIIAAMKENKARLTAELIEDYDEIAVIFYPRSFHNLKAAIKKLYSKSDADMYYEDAPVSGERITNALREGEEHTLPPYMAEAAAEAYRALMRTGDGRLSDMLADKACLEAMKAFPAKHEILKSYVRETIAAADIRLALRADAELMEYAVGCEYFSAAEIARAASDGNLDELLQRVGFGEVTAENIDAVSEKRIADILAREKYNIFSPAPAINFILEYDRLIGIIRYILICKANGIDKEKITGRVSAYV